MSDWRTVIIGLTAVAVTAGCGQPEATKSADRETLTVTSSATPSAPAPSAPNPSAEGVRSELIPVTLPPGTKAACCGKVEGMEVWNAPSSYAYNVQTLREQLPIKETFEGLPWCSQDINGKLGLTTWTWSSGTEYLQVAVEDDGTITITRRLDEQGREGFCD